MAKLHCLLWVFFEVKRARVAGSKDLGIEAEPLWLFIDWLQPLQPSLELTILSPPSICFFNGIHYSRLLPSLLTPQSVIFLHFSTDMPKKGDSLDTVTQLYSLVYLGGLDYSMIINPVLKNQYLLQQLSSYLCVYQDSFMLPP